MRPLCAITFLILLVSCKSKPSKRQYAIRDFSAKLQPLLLEIVNEQTGYYKGWIEDKINKDELLMLADAENPRLRSVAYSLIVEKDSLNYVSFIKSHLDDTAMIFVSKGEWGMDYLSVSDFMLEDSKWDNEKQRNEVIEDILLHHNYLRAAYQRCAYLRVKPVYHDIVKNMVEREMKFGGRNFSDVQEALYMLAKYKKNEDTAFIKAVLMDNCHQMEVSSLSIIEQFPHEAYWEVMERYEHYFLYKDICKNGYRERGLSEDFISTVASFKTKKSAALLAKISAKIKTLDCFSAKDIEQELAMDIYRNKCAAYNALIAERKDIIYKKIARDNGGDTTGIKVEEAHMLGKQSTRKIHW